MKYTDYLPITHTDAYWTHDVPLFVGSFPYYHNQPRMVQGKIHLSEEHYSWGENELIPLSEKAGVRQYVHLRPYILEPELVMTVGLHPKPKHYADQDDAIGEVLKTEAKGMRQHDIGTAQAWYYPTEKTLILWECFVESSFRTHPLVEDPHMRNLWGTFEDWLRKYFPDATRITVI